MDENPNLDHLTKALNELADTAERGGDYQQPHVKADEILCEALEQLGYSELVEAYQRISKWYA